MSVCNNFKVVLMDFNWILYLRSFTKLCGHITILVKIGERNGQFTRRFIYVSVLQFVTG
jgi:hypothetical protein